jgi:hypothetical protein
MFASYVFGVAALGPLAFLRYYTPVLPLAALATAWAVWTIVGLRWLSIPVAACLVVGAAGGGLVGPMIRPLSRGTYYWLVLPVAGLAGVWLVGALARRRVVQAAAFAGVVILGNMLPLAPIVAANRVFGSPGNVAGGALIEWATTQGTHGEVREYVGEIRNDYTGPIEKIVAFLERARPEDTVFIQYGYYALMFHMPQHRVFHGVDQPRRSGRYLAADWVIPRRFWSKEHLLAAPPPAPLGYEYRTYLIDAPDVKWQNRPDQFQHYYRSPPTGAQPVVIYHLERR